MADYDETYSFTTQSGSNTGWTYWNEVIGEHSVAAENTDQYWCWTNVGSTSSGTGPPTGVPCVYTETSSPTAAGEEFRMTLTDAINASTYGLYVTLDRCSQGNSAFTLYFEAYNGTDWVEIDSWVGDAVTTFTSEGPYNFTSYNNTDFKIRFRVIAATSGNVYQSDGAVDEVRIYGDYKAQYEISGVTYDKTGTILGSCDVFLCRDNGDNTATYLAHTTSNAVTGAYSFTGGYSTANHFVIAWKDDTPHVFDCTDHVLQGTAV